MDIITSLVAAIIGGLIPVLASLTGGNPKEQLLGTAIATLFLGIIFFAIIDFSTGLLY